MTKTTKQIEELIEKRVKEELDPTAFRCGVADMTGTDEQLTEIDGEYYNTDEVDEIRDAVESENEGEE